MDDVTLPTIVFRQLLSVVRRAAYQAEDDGMYGIAHETWGLVEKCYNITGVSAMAEAAASRKENAKKQILAA